ncbi:growth arrest-specific protein 2-like [Alosa alosa]|uniref:growth arrest-specific protein 2-like n=1 Tax=Alosa alosa TaxID=278164 RepID=UPI0020150868|nr:growth arrest-specific protein 2-like [Alosa alosa]
MSVPVSPLSPLSPLGSPRHPPAPDLSCLQAYHDWLATRHSASLLPMQEDLALWINCMLGVAVTADNLMDRLETGVLLCQLAEELQERMILGSNGKFESKDLVLKRQPKEVCLCLLQVGRIASRCGLSMLNDKHAMVRVGGGWETFACYLQKHDPCRLSPIVRPGIKPSARTNGSNRGNSSGSGSSRKSIRIKEISPDSYLVVGTNSVRLKK